MKRVRRIVKLLKIIAPEYIFGALGIIFLVVLFVLGNFFSTQKTKSTVPTEIAPTVFDGLTLQASSTFVYDVKNKREIFSKNGDAQLPLASLTKIMMAVTALSILPKNTVVTINQEFLKSEGDSGLYDNERWKLEDLIDITLLQSSNDGASAIASVAGASGHSVISDNFGRGPFIDAMNNKAKELGLDQTYFLNPTGLDEGVSVYAAYGSARDVSVLFSHAISTYPQIFDVTRSSDHEFSSLSAITHKVKNTNTFVNKIPSLLASKTGYTDLAGGNLVIAFDAGVNRPIVVSVLGSTEQGRFDDVEKLVWSTLEYLGEN